MNALVTPPSRKPHRLAPCCKDAIERARSQDALHRAQRNAPLADLELERNALGLALIGDKAVPSWLEPRHFFPTQHQLIYKAAKESKGSLTGAAELLRERTLLAAYGAPRMVSSAELVTLTEEALQAVQMGWEISFERLRELANQRALLSCMERCAIKLRGGGTHGEAIADLREHVRGCK